jgi:chromosomal replication initiator protein
MTGPDPQVKDKLLGHLRKAHSDICRQWFEYIDPIEVRDGTLVLMVPEEVQLKFLRRCCTEQFREAAQVATERLVSIEFVGPGDVHPGAVTTPGGGATGGSGSGSGANGAGQNGMGIGAGTAAGHEAMSAGGGDRSNSADDDGAINGHSVGLNHGEDHELVLSPDYSFDSFIVGPDNRLAHAAAIAVSRMPGKAYNPLFLHGGVGLGKTHLLSAICRATIEAKPETRIAYLSCEDFTTEFLRAVQEGRMHSFRHKFRNVDILVVDDIHDLARREQTQEEFFHTFNALFQHGRQIVLSSDAPPNEIPALEERLSSRFNCGLVARIDRPGFETRVEIVRSKARMRGIHMPDEVSTYVAARFDTNIRELEGAIIRVQGLAALDEVPITLALARLALGDQEESSQSSQPNVQQIIEAVARYYDLKLPDLLSRRKHKSIALPRQIGMYLARRHTRYSLEEIGGYFGGRDHTTVMHAVKQIDSKQAADEGLSEDVRRLEMLITDGRSSGTAAAG